MTENELRQHFENVRQVFGVELHKAIPLFDDCLWYPEEEMVRLNQLSSKIEWEFDKEKRKDLIAEFVRLRDQIQPLPNPQKKIWLWPEGKMPQITDYTDNSTFRYNHDPDFKPYMFEMLLPKGTAAKGAVVVVPGGDHGACTMTEGWQVCRELNQYGYQCFLLHNRVNHNPWCGQECGADVARAIRIIRSRADEYGIPENRVAFAGFSNGGITGEFCIRYYSGKQKVSDHFPGYIPDALDDFYGAPDAFLCIYGPRFKESTFDYSDVVYPPVFLAVGREDTAMENLNALYPDLIAHGISVEVHTFAGVPHGVGGSRLIDKTDRYPNFQLWLPLADAFMQDVYKKCNI